MTISVMLDLETWGTEPGCDIRSIGACVFDPVTGTVAGDIPHDRKEFFKGGMLHPGPSAPDNPYWFYIACDNPDVDTYRSSDGRGGYINHPHYGDRYKPKYPLHRDPRTVQWWSEQSDKAQAAFADPVDLSDGLMAFGRWLEGISAEKRIDGPIAGIRIWSHGPAFDPPILAAAYKAVGLPVPWHYRAPRDTRTCFDMAGIDDHSAWLEQHPGPLGIPHHALDDSICQARAVCAATARVREWADAYAEMQDVAADARFEDRG